MNSNILRSIRPITCLMLLTLSMLSCEKNSLKKSESQTHDAETQNPPKKHVSHPLVESARKQIGVVIAYDPTIYEGGYPPNDRGVCTDVIERAMRAQGYQLKEELDNDIRQHPERYPDRGDANINFRRVRFLRAFLQTYAENLPINTDDSSFIANMWQPGDIVTFSQIPGSLWHIAIVSDRYYTNGKGVRIPYIIHNYGNGAVEDAKLLTWSAPVNGHFRVDELLNVTRINKTI